MLVPLGDIMKQLVLTVILLILAQPFAAMAGDSVVRVADEGYANEYLADMPKDNDPLEPLNRGVHEFNHAVDSILLRPASQVYKSVLPEFARESVTNFLDNIEAPVVLLNSILQADAQNSFVTFWRFIFNTTLGGLGLFDIATELGMPPRNDEDFGQTLGVWGVGEGAYLVLPLLGPSNLRDVVGLVVNVLTNPFSYGLEYGESFALFVTRGVDSRTRFGRIIDNTYNKSLDPYSTFKSLYLQRRTALIGNRHAATPEQPVMENFIHIDVEGIDIEGLEL